MAQSRAGPKPHIPHVGLAVQVGKYQVRATGTMYQREPKFAGCFDDPRTVLVPLTGDLPCEFGREYRLVWAALQDFGGVPDNWRDFLESEIVPRLQDGQQLLAFCAGSHGRTGVFLASLIALLETPQQTPDPIAAVRNRHCVRAVETMEQAKAIFALRGQAVPQQYVTEFTRRPTHLGATAIAATQTSI